MPLKRAVTSDGTPLICGATTRQQTPCQGQPMPNGRCRMHGGKSHVGVAVATFRHGRHSKYLPARLLARYHEALSDPERLALHDELALTDARLADVLTRVDTGESGARWQAVQRACDRYADRRGEAGDAERLLALREAVTAGVADAAGWREVASLIAQRKALVESERRRMIELQQYLTAEQALALMTAVIQVVRQHVDDPTVLGAVSTELARLSGAARLE